MSALLFTISFAPWSAQADIDATVSLRSTLPSQAGQRSNRTAAGQRFGLFGSIEIEANGLPDHPKWKELLTRIKLEEARYASCDDDTGRCSTPVSDWQNMLHSIRQRSQFEQLVAINSYANLRARYTTDIAAYGRKDHWATPSEFLHGVGDCEDFAIFKFISLMQLGFPEDNVRLVIVKDTPRQLYHAVLTVRLNGRVIVLDSLREEVTNDTTCFATDPCVHMGLRRPTCTL